METNRFYYRDNWNGAHKEFDTLAQAKRSAKQEDGLSVTIYTEKAGWQVIAEIVKSNGYTYP